MEKASSSSVILLPSVGSSMLIDMKNPLEKDIIETARIEISENGRLTVLFKNREHYNYSNGKQTFLIGLLQSFKGLPENHEIMYYRISDEKECDLLFDWKKEKEDESKRRREEEEARITSEEEAEEIERARIAKGEAFAKRLAEDRKKEKKKEKKGATKKSKGIILYAPNSLAFMHSSMTRLQNLVLHRVVKALQPYIKKAIENKKNGVEERIMPETGYVEVQFPLSELACKSEYEKVEQEILELKNTYIAFDYDEKEGKSRLYQNLFDNVKVPLVGKSKMVKVRTTTGLTEILCNPFLPGYEFADKITKGFFSYQSNVLEYVRSRVTQRVYLWLSSFKKSEDKKVVFPLSQIRAMLSLEGKYNSWYDFRRRILDDSQSELEENSYRFDLSFRYHPIYKGSVTIGFPDEIEFEIIDNRENEEYLSFKANIVEIYRFMEENGLSKAQTDKLIVTIDAFTLDFAKEEIERICVAIGQGTIRNKAAFIYKTFLKNMSDYIKTRKRERKSETV